MKTVGARLDIYCCGCEKEVEPRLTDGSEIYPHRGDLKRLPFWKCDECRNFVGCHHKSRDREKPLGCIPTKLIRKARSDIHKLIDPIWKIGKMSRSKLYKMLSNELGREYHTGDINSIEEARKVYHFAKTLIN